MLKNAVAVFSVGLQKLDPFGESLAGVEPLGVAERVPTAADVKKVLGCSKDQNGRRGAHHDPVGVVHSKGHLTEEMLLAVLRSNRVEQFRHACDVATWRGRADAVVEGHDVAGLSAASTATSAADTLRIDFRA